MRQALAEDVSGGQGGPHGRQTWYGRAVSMVRHVVTSFVFLVLIGVALFVPAGTLRWPMAWATLAVFAGLAVAAVVLLDPEMLRQREAVERAGPAWDPPIAIGGLVFMIILPMLISGLDVRRHGGSSPLVPSVRLAAFVLFAAGQVFGLWAMRANRFFAKFVRIQHERGHRVVTDGPYAFVRHPGYAGGIVSYVALPVALGSPRAALIACIGGMFFVVRTWLEDRTLHAALPGYRDYAARVRWRLLPGVW
jgi:protein-S-isoprenylcysteine O-methyltransferase Ste14